MMQRELPLDSVVSFEGAGGTVRFEILKCLGRGGSCVAYLVKYTEAPDIEHKGVLKELVPVYLGEDCRNNDFSLKIPAAEAERFSTDLKNFKGVYKTISAYLSENLSAANFHPSLIGYFEGNGTGYTLTSCDYGESYDKRGDDSLLSILKTAYSVTRAVELYHQAGFLHLDIKPKNILILDGVSDLIKLFDYDSLTSIEKVKNREVAGIPVPEDYYVPELAGYDLRNIGVETDIFEIGALIYVRLFQKAPNAESIEQELKTETDGCRLLAGISPQAKSELTELFLKTVRTSKRSRYRTTRELKEKLQAVISLITQEAPYLISSPKWQPSAKSVGRQTELKEIKRRLDTDGYVFIRGIGGLGKSELAKLFVKQYQNEYHTIHFCQFTDSLQTVTASLPFHGIKEEHYQNREDLIKEKNKVLHLADSKTLLIIDNFNVPYDAFLREFLPTDLNGFRVIFTTRCKMAADYYESKSYDLPKLGMEDCKTLFFSHLEITPDEEEEKLAEQLISFAEHHTLLLVLSALSVKKSGLPLSELLINLYEQKTDTMDAEIFHEYDTTSGQGASYSKLYTHLSAVFSVSNLTGLEKEILKNATLISSNGISLSAFVKNCGSRAITEDAVCRVVNSGWLEKDANDLLFMHPVVSDLLSVESSMPKNNSYYQLSDHLIHFCVFDSLRYSDILAQLSVAKQLDRRMKTEMAEYYIFVTLTLGRLYTVLYQPENAGNYLRYSLELAEQLSIQTVLNDPCADEPSSTNKQRLIASIYNYLGDLEKDFGLKSKAIPYYQKALTEGKKIGNRFYDIVVPASISLADCYLKDNHYREAYLICLEALNFTKRLKLDNWIAPVAFLLINISEELGLTQDKLIYQRIYQKYHVPAGLPKSNLNPYENIDPGTISGFHAAFDEYADQLAWQRKEFGQESPAYRDAERFLWMFYLKAGQTEQAMQLLNEDISFISETYGEYSAQMAKRLSFASSCLIEMNQFDTAHRFAAKAILICEQLSDTDSYTYAEASLILARLYGLMGDNYTAKQWIEKIDFSGFSGVDTIKEFLQSAGLVLFNLGEYDRAEAFCKQAIAQNSSDAVNLCTAYNTLAMIYMERGTFSEAEKYIARLRDNMLAYQKDANDKERFIGYYRSAAMLAYKKGDYNKAIQTLNEFLDTVPDIADSSYYCLNVHLDLGMFYRGGGQTEESNRQYRICEKILAENHMPESAYLTLYNNTALNYVDIAQYEKAMEYYQKLIRVSDHFLEPQTLYEATVCHNIGCCYYFLGNTEYAIELMEKATPVYYSHIEHITNEYLQLAVLLANVYFNSEYWDKALDFSDKLLEIYDPAADPTGDYAVNLSGIIISSLFRTDRLGDVYAFLDRDEIFYRRHFGKTSPVTVYELLQVGIILSRFGQKGYLQYVKQAKALIDQTGDYNSVNYAHYLNTMGVHYLDVYEQNEKALQFFKEAKALLERINAEKNDLYQTVLGNIRTANEAEEDE